MQIVEGLKQFIGVVFHRTNIVIYLAFKKFPFPAIVIYCHIFAAHTYTNDIPQFYVILFVFILAFDMVPVLAFFTRDIFVVPSKILWQCRHFLLILILTLGCLTLDTQLASEDLIQILVETTARYAPIARPSLWQYKLSLLLEWTLVTASFSKILKLERSMSGALSLE